MKSEKAKEYINCIVPNKGNFDYCAEVGRLNGSVYMDVCKAVELAEQEAEERMREKAVSAFDDMWFENGEDGEFEPDYEYHRKNFIQKLNEE